VNQNKEYKYISFVEYWHEIDDDLCLNLPVLKPAWVAFTGFRKEEEK